jgi:hypothetical protein
MTILRNGQADFGVRENFVQIASGVANLSLSRPEQGKSR